MTPNIQTLSFCNISMTKEFHFTCLCLAMRSVVCTFSIYLSLSLSPSTMHALLHIFVLCHVVRHYFLSEYFIVKTPFPFYNDFYNMQSIFFIPSIVCYTYICFHEPKKFCHQHSVWTAKIVPHLILFSPLHYCVRARYSTWWHENKNANDLNRDIYFSIRVDFAIICMKMSWNYYVAACNFIRT